MKNFLNDGLNETEDMSKKLYFLRAGVEMKGILVGLISFAGGCVMLF